MDYLQSISNMQCMEIVALPLASLMNFILSTGYTPSVPLEGLLTPVPKKDKDQTLPTDYRGVTVLSILGKVLEKVLQKKKNRRPAD